MQAPSPVPTYDSVPTMFATSASNQSDFAWLNCLIENDSILFSIPGTYSAPIGVLKVTIQQLRAMGTLKDVDPQTLDLWKPKDSNPINADETAAEHLESLGDDLSKFADKLNPVHFLSSIFPHQPHNRHIHIIVKFGVPAEGQKRKITPKEHSLDIQVIDAQIKEELNSIRGVILRFLKNPEPPAWVPPDYITESNRKFLTRLQIPCYDDGSPSLLFHDLDACDNDKIKKIFGSHKHLFICNTSGSGKTRRIMEGLTKYWGFYFVTIPDPNDVGVRDLYITLERVSGYKEWINDIRSLPPLTRARQSEINSSIASKHLRKLLAARIVVFQLFLELAIEVDGKILEKHKRIWLLFQLSDRLGGPPGHPFVRIIKNSLLHASDEALMVLVDRFAAVLGKYLPESQFKYLPESQFIIVLDEAQRAATAYPYPFISSTSDEIYRSIIREIVKVFTSLPVKLVLSGTGLSLADLDDAMASGVSKPSAVELFHQLGMFDSWLKLKPFLERYIPAPILESPSGHHLQQRIREYLLGRYRFSVSFLEFFLKNGLESPHKLLNTYIERHAKCLPGDGDLFTSDEPELHIQVELRTFEWERLRLDLPACRAAVQIVQSHLTRGNSPTFGPVSVKLVEYGLAHLRDKHEGHIVEPLAFLSLMQWLQNQDGADLVTNIRSRLAYPESRGEAYEELTILYLLRVLRYPVPFNTIFNFHKPPVWANEMVQIVGCLDGISVAVDVLGDAPQNPGLGVVHYADNIDDVISWIQTTATAPAVLVATHLFGPDVMIRCSSPPLNSTTAPRNGLVIGQLKSYMGGNKDTLDAETTSHAITSLHPNHWFKRSPLEKRQKLKDAIEKHCILRFVGGYPLHPNLKSGALSVVRAIDDLGPNVALATIRLDEFKASFISEDEVRNVLVPMEHALARKRKSSEIDS